MQDWQVKLMLEAQAAMVRVEGMKASNAQALHCHDAPYHEKYKFDEEAGEIERLAREITHG